MIALAVLGALIFVVCLLVVASNTSRDEEHLHGLPRDLPPATARAIRRAQARRRADLRRVLGTDRTWRTR